VRKTKNGGHAALRSPAPSYRLLQSTDHFFLAAAFFAGAFFAAAFLAGAAFFAGAFLAAAFFAGAFLAAAFFAGAFFAAAFFAGAFFAAAFLAGAFFAAAFLAGAFFAATLFSFFLVSVDYLLLRAALSVLLAVNFIRVDAAMFTAAPV
jgi:hypothetical protein